MALSTEVNITIIFGVLATIVGILTWWINPLKWLKSRQSRNRHDKASRSRDPTLPEGSSGNTEIQLEEGIFRYHYMSKPSGSNGILSRHAS
ncbi:hypothetical protein BDV29DRAFT_178676 [Aspergillus leporis]|uniref:Uncharacterized protein n=1 Tax=Aspergillus leporis TaxID=41062 RepID=A0A5N5WTW1_9EURO|nr:hypothetical protein BDV29DRAFT_178676 [Aspergillus leporis]